MQKAKREDTLKQAKEIILKVLKEAPARVYLFGSWARGDERSSSDIDIAIEPIGVLSPSLLQIVREELEESCIPYCFDIVDTREADPNLIKNIKMEGILWKDC